MAILRCIADQFARTNLEKGSLIFYNVQVTKPAKGKTSATDDGSLRSRRKGRVWQGVDTQGLHRLAKHKPTGDESRV